MALSSLAACTVARYLPQAVWGQLDLQARAQPIEQVLPRAPPPLARLLEQVPAIKEFGRRHGLAVSDNYDAYAELDRDAAVWVVSASAPLAFEVTTWWFPVVGSVPYLGWFDKRDALRFADQLAREGLDVHVRAVSAYSTLGWFPDPILSTMLTRGHSVTGDFVNTVLHESVHATVYVDGQGTFNESLAMFVADRMTPEYLAAAFGGESLELGAYLAEEGRRERKAELLLRAYRHLAALYAAPAQPLEKLARKHRILLELEAQLQTQGPLNNATLAGFRSYRAGKERFATLLEICENDWRRFLASVASVDESRFAAEQQTDLTPVLDDLVARGCPDPA